MRHSVIGFCGLIAAMELSFASGLHAQSQLSPKGALATLMAGNARFVNGASVPKPLGEGVRRTLARGQKPFAIVVTCSDSRVTPEHLFNVGLGEIFVIRTAGNVCDPDSLASIEYAAEHLGTSLCIVMAHTDCDAVRLASDGSTKTRAQAGLAQRLQLAIRTARR